MRHEMINRLKFHFYHLTFTHFFCHPLDSIMCVSLHKRETKWICCWMNIVSHRERVRREKSNIESLMNAKKHFSNFQKAFRSCDVIYWRFLCNTFILGERERVWGSASSSERMDGGTHTSSSAMEEPSRRRYRGKREHQRNTQNFHE